MHCSVVFATLSCPVGRKIKYSKLANKSTKEVISTLEFPAAKQIKRK
jgi:hypothetical protein